MATAPKMSSASGPPEVVPAHVLDPPHPGSLEQRVLDIFRELLTELGSQRAVHTLSLHSSLDRELGLGSLERVELLVRCEARFEVRLPDEIAQEAETPAEWASAIEESYSTAAGEPTQAVRSLYRIVQPAREAPPALVSARNWVEVLRRHADLDPERTQVHLIEEDSGQDISYGKLLQTASRVAAGLNARGLRRNDTVAIMLPTCADFLYAFFGVMLAGGIAVPIYPPARLDKIEEYVRRQVSILRNAGVRFLISFDRAKSISQIMRLSIPGLVAVTSVDALLDEAGRTRSPAALEPSDTAFIQYTSGSTGEPKGVVLSHSNVLANVRGIGWAVRFRPTDLVVSWLPLYHDMGLIGSWLFSVYFGAPITLLSPLSFLSRPERWLWAMHDSRGTLCPAPNFAYELCARKIADRAIEGLDLSSWRVAINAGEAVLAQTLQRFAKRFAPYGFRAQSYVPCYGLAESSVALAFPAIDRVPIVDVIRRDIFETQGRAVPGQAAHENDPGVLRFVANGKPLPEHEIRIVDEEGSPVGERVQGHLFFRGPSRTSGYFRNPQATAAITTGDGWMDSGDLGYWAGGELYVTGRSKDLIVKSGRNIIPQEVEAAAADVPGVRRGCIAAFGAVDRDSGTERLVVVAETRAVEAEEMSRIEAEVMSRVDAVLGIPADKVVLVPPQSIPKTSSGKIRRNATRSLYLQGELHAVKRAPWLQMVHLWLEHLGSWIRLSVRRVAALIERAYASTVLFTISGCAGILARLVPGKGAASRIISFAARAQLRLTGNKVELCGRFPESKAAMVVANRAGQFDPLVVTAVIRTRFAIADRAALAGLPVPVAFLLKPLLVPPVYGETTPRGGTLRQRISQVLENGQSVVMFPEAPAGRPAELSPVRLDVIYAASETCSALLPIGVHGTGHILQDHSSSKFGNLNFRAHQSENEARLCVGEPIRVEIAGHQDAVVLRSRLRKELGELSQRAASMGP
jgi:fatty-acyl-CoA synthase